ncbi:MAG: hypothetical protein M1818_007346 [Claussenomyces sp. TS43310]|nr:MAG: hypothetical protein M1818_007346 [Claussenomyces sp. TS43310]
MALTEVSRAMTHNTSSVSAVQHDDSSNYPILAVQNESSASNYPISLSLLPELGPVDRQGPVSEKYTEDGTSGGAVNEPVTSTDTQRSHPSHHESYGIAMIDASQDNTIQNVHPELPLILATAATPPKRTTTCSETGSARIPQASSSTRESSVGRGFSHLSRRSNLHPLMTSPVSDIDASVLARDRGLPNASIPDDQRTPPTQWEPPVDLFSAIRSGSPPSTGYPKELETSLDPSESQFLASVKNNTSSTGPNIRSRFGITFAGPEKTMIGSHGHDGHSSSSFDLYDNPSQNTAGDYELTWHHWEMPAVSGTGLKARRLSLSLPDDFNVDIVNLHKEFSGQSKVFGRRGRTLGKGATSTVTLMTRKGSAGELYAVKKFRKRSKLENEEEYEAKVKSEYSIAKSLHHPNIVETIRLCTHQGRWNHVMEYCQEGDMFSIVQKRYLTKEDRLGDRLCLFKQLVQGISYLHEHGIAHRDIKLENLLLTKDSKLKITDFGVSEVFSGIHPGLRAAAGECGKEMNVVRLCSPGICGSLPYIAPEVVSKQGEYDPRPLDVWSSAIVMLHLIFGGALWSKAKSGDENYDALLRGWSKWEQNHAGGQTISETDYPHVMAFDHMVNPPALRRLLISMLHPSPAKRCSIAEVAKNRWFKHIDCCQVDSYDDPEEIVDASKSRDCFKSAGNRVVRHNHLPPTVHRGHGLVRLPGSTEM